MTSRSTSRRSSTRPLRVPPQDVRAEPGAEIDDPPRAGMAWRQLQQEGRRAPGTCAWSPAETVCDVAFVCVAEAAARARGKAAGQRPGAPDPTVDWRSGEWARVGEAVCQSASSGRNGGGCARDVRAPRSCLRVGDSTIARVKVLLVSFYWPPAGGGGVQRPLKLAQYLPALGIETHVLAPDDPQWMHRDDGLRAPTTRGCTARATSARAAQAGQSSHGTDGIDRAPAGAAAGAAADRPRRERALDAVGDPGCDPARAASTGSTPC